MLYDEIEIEGIDVSNISSTSHTKPITVKSYVDHIFNTCKMYSIEIDEIIDNKDNLYNLNLDTIKKVSTKLNEVIHKKSEIKYHKIVKNTYVISLVVIHQTLKAFVGIDLDIGEDGNMVSFMVNKYPEFKPYVQHLLIDNFLLSDTKVIDFESMDLSEYDEVELKQLSTKHITLSNMTKTMLGVLLMFCTKLLIDYFKNDYNYRLLDLDEKDLTESTGTWFDINITKILKGSGLGNILHSFVGDNSNSTTEYL